MVEINQSLKNSKGSQQAGGNITNNIYVGLGKKGTMEEISNSENISNSEMRRPSEIMVSVNHRHIDGTEFPYISIKVEIIHRLVTCMWDANNHAISLSGGWYPTDTEEREKIDRKKLVDARLAHWKFIADIRAYSYQVVKEHKDVVDKLQDIYKAQGEYITYFSMLPAMKGSFNSSLHEKYMKNENLINSQAGTLILELQDLLKDLY